MEFSLALVGLGLIVCAWLVQVIYSFANGPKMTVFFAALQFFGIGFLIADSYQAGLMNGLAYLNVAAAVGALVMVVLIIMKRESK